MLRRLGPLFLLLVSSLACSGGTTTTSSSPPGQPSLAALSCQPGCAARPAEGMAALKSGNYQAALEAYRCADTPEAAFGAGVATLITAIEGPAVTSILADFGEQPIKASSVVGTTGFLSRYASRWKGTGSVTRSDAGGKELETSTLDHGKQNAYSGSSYVSARMLGAASLAKVSLSFNQSGALQSGQRISISCTGSGGNYADISYSTATVSCHTPYSYGGSNPDCANGGAIIITKPGVGPGDAVEYTLDNVLLTCSPRNGNGSETTARLKGTLSTFVASERVDLSGLPALLSGEDVQPKVPAGVTIEKVLASASGLAGSMEQASCYFNAAGAPSGDGKVFELPGELTGGTSSVAASHGDAKILAGFAALTASAIVAAEAYRLPIELRGLICSKSAGIPCITEEETATRINAGIQALADRQKIEIARRLLRSALTSFSESADRLGPQSFIVKDPTTQSSIDRMKAVVDKLIVSLDTGSTPMPYVSPTLSIDLKSIFDNPPDPAKISVDPVAYDPARRRLSDVDAFWDQAFPPATVGLLRSNDKYTFDNGQELVLEPVSLRFETSFPF